MAYQYNHPRNAPGFSKTNDPFASFNRDGGANFDDDEGIDFDAANNEFAGQLDDEHDDFNDDTFGGDDEAFGGGATVGQDFDFFGQTAQVSNTISKEQNQYAATHAPPRKLQQAAPPVPQYSKPARTGYEKYEGKPVSDLQIDPSLWGAPAPQARETPAPPPPQQAYQQPARKMLSLDEVEAQIREQSRKAAANQAAPPQQGFSILNQIKDLAATRPAQSPAAPQDRQQYPPPQNLQHQQQQQPPQVRGPPPGLGPQPSRGGFPGGPPQILQRPPPNQQPDFRGPPVPHPNNFTPQHFHQQPRAPSPQRPLSVEEEAVRAKRNHKIFMLSKGNGLMTPQDKHFITRIQLQQLVVATGTPDQLNPEANLDEDFYYQVFSQIRGGPRQDGNRPLSHFAQTYLFQTGGRYNGRRFQGRNFPENPLQRMEHQVQRAVEAAKLKPKNSQLVIEGSLGKISFSNAKTPKPLLNLSRGEQADGKTPKRPTSAMATPAAKATKVDKKAVLKNIEEVYALTMQLEDHTRQEPPPPIEGAPAEIIERHMLWYSQLQSLSSSLWKALHLLDPVKPENPSAHPFIAFLSFSKGKKIIPRIFNHLSTEQRVTMLTMLVLNLDALDVIKNGAPSSGAPFLAPWAREAVDLFSATVVPTLFSYISEAPLFTIVGLLGLILDRTHLHHLSRTKIGLAVLTMLTSRATLIHESGSSDDAEWNQWRVYYSRLFDILEPVMEKMFPGPLVDSSAQGKGEDDVYVWQFLASIGSGADQEQQQRLVVSVKDRVIETVQYAKGLSNEFGARKLANVNLFMRAIGLDVELLG